MSALVIRMDCNIGSESVMYLQILSQIQHVTITNVPIMDTKRKNNSIRPPIVLNLTFAKLISKPIKSKIKL